MKPLILFFAPHTVAKSMRTGISRVVSQLVKVLPARVRVEFVKWDSIDGQLRYCNRNDLRGLFRGGSDIPNVGINRFAERRRYRFEETLPRGDRSHVWLLCPEMSYQPPCTTEMFACLLAQAREYRIRSAAIFYDLIPITNAPYDQGAEAQHARYVHTLLGADLILPISAYAADDLARYYRERLGISDELRRKSKHAIVPLPLATLNEGSSPPEPSASQSDPRRDVIMLLGTVEPRKQQVRVLRLLEAGRIAERYGLKIVVIGSLHHAVMGDFHRLVKDNPNIEYRGYASDADIDALFAQSRFSVFASNDEGFGLPICESVARGVPCLTANFGAMREVGEGGGCLLVDVNDDEELAAALERLAQDDAFCAQLRAEIGHRTFRTWDDYAEDALRVMSAYAGGEDDGQALHDDVASAISSFRAGSAEASTRDMAGQDWIFACVRSVDSAVVQRLPSKGTRAKGLALYLAGANLAVGGIDRATAAILFEADAWFLDDEETYRRLVLLAKDHAYEGLLPTLCLVKPAKDALPGAAANALVAMDREASRRRLIASREAMLQSVYPPIASGAVLSIVISTYNRGPFVEENVRWILSQITRFDGHVRLTVVDNASTDDTGDRLERFRQDPLFEYLVNAGNVGMLGNLQVCASLLRARHVWVIGDDDFIVPDAFERVFAALRASPSLPFIFLNFGVYHRVSLGPEDSAETLIRDPIRLAPDPSPTGKYPIRSIGVEHDNLFTAIYPIVFRLDILAACFNYPFTGTPFGSLVESIPTTKIILESYASTEALWIADIGIVGNAHNSWQRYRVPWHGVLMPLAFELARAAGMDSAKLHQWSLLHEKLYEEAKGLFPGQDLRKLFDARDLDAHFRVYRRDPDDAGLG